MSWNKADQILRNEVRKIDTKINGHKNAIRKLEADRAEVEGRISKD